MTSPLDQILSMRTDIEALTDLAPGNGFDAIGEALTGLAAQPINVEEAKALLADAESLSPGLVKTIQSASIHSEMELELFHARQMLDSSEQSTQHDNLFQDYQYDWFTGRANLEASFIPAAETGNEPVVCYIGASGIPFSALAIQRRRKSRAIWFDPNEATRTLACKIVSRLGIQTIAIHDATLATIETVLSENPAAYISVLDAAMVTPKFLSVLKRCGAKNISFVTTHGLNELLYPAAPETLISEVFEFTRGYYPERLSGMPAGWMPSAGLSFVSLALYK